MVGDTVSHDRLLTIQELSIYYKRGNHTFAVVRNVSMSVAPGECLGVVGESGSGKSQTFLAAMGLLTRSAEMAGSIKYQDIELMAMERKRIDKIRGSKITMIFQDPLTSLTPHHTIGRQISEPLIRHCHMDSTGAKQEALRWLNRVRISDAAQRMNQYPHELSGGMRQRVMIATAMAPGPRLLIADEPTTALDVSVQAEVLDIIDDLRRETGTAVILISHDMGVIARMADRLLIMQQGLVVEEGTAESIFRSPSRSYTRELLSAVPRLDECGITQDTRVPVLHDIENRVIDVKQLQVSYSFRTAWWRRAHKFNAVDNVSFNVQKHETLGIVGESGCGKSTLARALLQMIPIRGGDIAFFGHRFTSDSTRHTRRLRENMQIVFQDAVGSLSPRMTIGESIGEPVRALRPEISRAEREQLVQEMLLRVGLSSDFAGRYPHALSGGQNQRAGIARATILRPKLLICDEAVAALDVTVRAQILNLLRNLQREFGIAIIFISHDLGIVRQISDRVMVLLMGRIVECASNEQLFTSPQHPYTQMLLAAVPVPDPQQARSRARHSPAAFSRLDPRSRFQYAPSRLLGKKLNEDINPPLLVEKTSGHWVEEFDLPQVGREPFSNLKATHAQSGGS